MKLAVLGPAISKRPVTIGWAVANLAGMFIFLRWSASCCWIEPELKDVPGASGGAAFVWFFGPFLIFAAFVVADFTWALLAEIRSPPGRRWSVLAAPFLVLVSWAAAFVVDGLHHGS